MIPGELGFNAVTREVSVATGAVLAALTEARLAPAVSTILTLPILLVPAGVGAVMSVWSCDDVSTSISVSQFPSAALFELMLRDAPVPSRIGRGMAPQTANALLAISDSAKARRSFLSMRMVLNG